MDNVLKFKYKYFNFCPSSNPNTRLKIEASKSTSTLLTSQVQVQSILNTVHRRLHLCIIVVMIKAMKTKKQQYYAFIHYLNQGIQYWHFASNHEIFIYFWLLVSLPVTKQYHPLHHMKG